jgi:hypothetical protein
LTGKYTGESGEQGEVSTGRTSSPLSGVALLTRSVNICILGADALLPMFLSSHMCNLAEDHQHQLVML